MSHLVLARKVGQRVLIGDNIAVTVVRVVGNHVSLSFDAPRDINIVREELGEKADYRVPQDGPLLADGGPPGPPLLPPTEETGVFGEDDAA